MSDDQELILPFVMLLCWMRSYAGDEECSCGSSPDYEIDSFVDAEGLLEWMVQHTFRRRIDEKKDFR